MILSNYTYYYFLGIGGIGMSAIARYLNQAGSRVLGYDRVRTPLCSELEREGMPIHYEDCIENIPSEITPENTLVIFTPAIPKDSAQLNYFLNKGYTLNKRSEILGHITSDSFNISVAGTHGKTTTSALISHLLHHSGIHFGAFLGGLSTNLGSNYFNSCRPDERAVTVTEADEFDRSFLTLSPNLAVITSMDADHLDIYGTGDELKKSFFDFIHKIEPNGKLFLRHGLQHPGLKDVTILTYGINGGDYNATKVRVENGWFLFDFETKGIKWPDLKLGIPGNHNIENALAAIAVAIEMKLDLSQIKEGLKTFKGVKRRFEFICREPDFVYIDDYAHHPAELEAFIKSVKMLYPDKKITGVFQPHLYSRTKDFASGFAESLSLLDEAILLDIYPARELPMAGVSSDLIFDRITSDKKHKANKENVLHLLKILDPEVLVTMGAGDIDTLVTPINAMLKP